MQIYHYSSAKVFIGASEAKISPLDGKIMIPKNATVLVPPAQEEGHVLMFLNGGWVNRELPVVENTISLP